MSRKPIDETVPVTKRALTQRINRKLRKEKKVLRSRGEDGFVLIDMKRNNEWTGGMGAVVKRLQFKSSVENFGRKLRVLHPWERLRD